MKKLNHKKGFTQVVDFGFVFENTSKNLKSLFCKFISRSNLSFKKTKTFSKPKFTTGFTLIELLVVISIIGLLSSVVLASLSSARQKAKAVKIVAEMNQLKTALELYRNDKGKYPNEGVFQPKCDESFAMSGVTCDETAQTFLTRELVTNNKYIPSIPFFNPDNLYYITSSSNNYLGDSSGSTFMCGDGRVVTKYFVGFYSDIPLNYSKSGLFESDPPDNPHISYDLYSGSTDGNWYCIGE